MTVQEYLLINGPTLSGELIEYYKKQGSNSEAIRKRLSRISHPIYKLNGFFKDNQSFFYHIDHYNDNRFYENLRIAFKKCAKRYYAVIVALEYHKGYVRKEELASYCFSPISNLKTHKPFNTIIADLLKLNIIREYDDYYTLSSLISVDTNKNKNYSKALELSKNFIGAQFYDYARSIGLVSYNSGRFNSEFSKFQFCFTAPSYITGLVKYGSVITPGFIVADILLGNVNNEINIDFFIQKINIIRSQKSSNFIPFIVTDSISPEALKKLKENGIVIGFINKLFGNEYEELLKSLISVVTNAGAILKKNPDAYLKLLDDLKKLVDGKTNNLRGDLFEFAVGYYYSNLCQSLDIGKKMHFQGNYKEVDVFADFREKIIICECKAYKSKIDLVTIENWLSKKIPLIYDSIRLYEYDKKIEFEFWSTSGFNDDAIELLNKKKETLKKYSIQFYSKQDIIAKARSSKSTKIIEIMQEYFTMDV